MRFEETQRTLLQIIKQWNFSYIVATVLLISNIILAYKVVFDEEHWLLIPQFNTDHTIEVTSKQYSNNYLIDWADGITRHLLTVNPDCVEQKVEDVLKITSVGHGELKTKLKADAKKIKQDQISTVFYPKEFIVDQSQNHVTVTGQFLSYFGTDKAPISLEKTYILTWKTGSRGCLLLNGSCG